MQGQEYRKYTIEDFKEVLKLQKKGLSTRKISNIVKISPTTIWYWTCTSRKPRVIYSKNLEKKLNKKSKKLSDSLAYIYGVLIGDGYIEKSKRTYRIVLSVTDRDFANEFICKLKEWTGMEPKLIERNVTYDHTTKWGNRIVGKSHYYVVRLNSKQVVEFLNSKGSFRTYNWNVPKDIKNCNRRKIICSFLRGLFDSDGYVAFSKRTRFVGIQIFNTGGLKEVQELLRRIGIKSRIKQNTTQKLKNMHFLITSDRQSLEIFSTKISFSIKRKRESLKKLLQSYSGREVYKSEEIKGLILELLEKKPMTIKEISESINRSISTTSFHLRKLQKKNKVKMICRWRKIAANASNIWLLSNTS